MKNQKLVQNYYVLPCCLLLLNLGVELVSYKTRALHDPWLRTGAIMAMVLFGGSFVGFLLAPAIARVVDGLHRGSRYTGGQMGGVFFLLLLGVAIYAVYFRVYIHGIESVLPAEWRNGK